MTYESCSASRSINVTTAPSVVEHEQFLSKSDNRLEPHKDLKALLPAFVKKIYLNPF